MDIGITSARYATALLAFATENGEEARVYEEMTTASIAFRTLPQLHTLLQNPALADEDKQRMLASACSPKDELSKTTQRFVELIVQNKRCDLMPFFAQSFIERYRQSKHFISSRLVVPTAISEEVRERFKQLIENLTDSSVEFQVEVDKEIEGGFILEYDTYRLDASVRSQFQRLRRHLGR